MAKIKIGYAPTRRSIFSAPDAVKYRGLTADRLKELGIDFVDITDVNDEGLLYDEAGRIKIAEKFKKEKIDGLFLPHCNFGTEFECARLAKELNVPVLLWGPLDERPDENGVRLRDTQCGLFATGKGGVDNTSFRDIVEAYNCHLLRHLVASETQGLDGSDCNQVIVRKITVCQSISPVNNCKHICHCSINGWRKLVDNTAGTGHSVIMDSMIKSLQAL